jgi:diguanylate cyclase (GGDEF)-like protein/PAS domain S-box-containing protein
MRSPASNRRLPVDAMTATQTPDPNTKASEDPATLTARLRKLAEDKSNLQLIVRLMERINPLPGVEDMIRSLLASIVETIGGTNIKLYYWIGEQLRYADFAGRTAVLAEIDDPSVARVAQDREFLEELGGETMLTAEQVAGAWTWTFPLVVGSDLVGVIRIENLHVSGASLRSILPVFFSHAALILSNEIRNFARQQAEAVQRRLNRELKAISDCNQALMRADNEQMLLDQICHIICDEAGYRAAFVAYADDDAEQTVRPVAWAGVDEDYFSGAQLTWADRDLGRGPLGTAIRTGRVVEIPDVTTHPRMTPWRDRALARGYRSGVAFPLTDDRQKTFGGLLIYSGEVNAISGEEIRLLDELAGDLAFGITALRLRSRQDEAKRQLVASEQLFRALVENSPDPIARYDRELHRVYVNPAIRLLFAGPVDDVIGGTPKVVSPLLDPDSYMDNIRRVIETGEDCMAEGAYRTLNGDIRWSSWRFTPEFDADGGVATVLVVSHDITERRKAEEERQAHLRFLEGMSRIDSAIQGATDVDQMMIDVLDTLLEVFGCDRAFLLHPCDPTEKSWTVPMERTRPEYPGVLALGQSIPMGADVAATLQALLDSTGPLRFGPGMDQPLPGVAAERFAIKSLLSVALRPKIGKPWQLGLHQCSRLREWNAEELRIFEEAARRISDALDTLITTRNLRDSEERFRLVFENSPLPIWEEDFSIVKRRLDEVRAAAGADIEDYLTRHPEIVRQCAELVCIVDVNQAAVDLHEAGSKQLLYAGLARTFTDESFAAFGKELAALANGRTEMRFDSVVQTLTGRRREVTLYFTVCPGYEQDLGKVLVSLIDITERKRAEDELRLAASVFATSQEGILISDPNNRIIDVNPAFTRLTGYSAGEAIGRDPGFLSAGRQSREFYAAMWHAIETNGTWQGEIWNRRKSGDVYVELLSIIAVKDSLGRLQHYVGAFSDISILKEHEADLDRIAHYDVLTAVPNRRLLGDRLEQAIARARRLGKGLAVCYLDLDGFKPINDQFGHEGGDRLLVEIARRLQSISRADDTVARLGGDEFVMLWNDIGRESECFQALERILAEVSAPMDLDGVTVSVSASIGVTLYPDDNVDADSLLRHADHAMYSAKQLGKNRYQLFDSRLERQISSRFDFLAKVNRALDGGQFELYYQPKVDCVAGKVTGVEALIRWNDPILGLVGPKEFLPLIENDNLALRTGRWVVEEAVRQSRAWHDKGIVLPISVNIFPRHLKYPTFIDDLRCAIAEYWPGMPEKRLLLEIVETSDLEELDPIEAVISECLGMGIGFSLDDFGTGYSSLVYLRRLSVEELKIDQSFVRDMLEDPDDQAIVAGVIGLGKAFGLRVVAEGVESERQAAHLVTLGCPVVQGYGFGRPMPASALEAWLADTSVNGLRICT